MAAHLVPCPGCQRHVRVSETACPFCEAVLDESVRNAAVGPLPTTRLSRGALHAFRASVTMVAIAVSSAAAAGTLFACSSDSDTNSGYGQQQTGGNGSGGNAGTSTGGTVSSGGNANGSSGASAGGTANGGTTNAGGMNAGGDTSAGGDDGFGGGAVALYGAVPVDPPVDDADAGKTDAGPDDPGGIQPLYGAAQVPS